MQLRLLLCAALLAMTSFAQTPFKGMYVNGFAEILGNPDKEDSLLRYASSNGFTSLSLYNLHLIDFEEAISVSNLAHFIRKARVDYQFSEMGAVGENAGSFSNRITPYNLGRADTNEQFNVFNLEFEFWAPGSIANYYCADYLQPGGYSCDEPGAFAFYMRQLEIMDSITALYNWKSEIYLGHFDQQQATSMAAIADRILLSNYNADPENTFPYSETRLERLGNTGFDVTVAALFSAEPDYLQPWLIGHNNDLDSAFQIYKHAYQAAEGAWKQHVRLIGQQWFTYSDLPYQIGTAGLISMDEISFKVFPNPAEDYVEIISIPGIKPVLTNLDGQILPIDIQPIEDRNLYLNLNHLSPGIYMLYIGNKPVKLTKL